MTLTKTALTAVLAAVAIGAAAAPEIASAASCTVTKAHAVKKVVHRKTVRRPVAVAAYRERAPRTVTRTIVETRYIHEPARVIVAPAPVYERDYAPYPVYYHSYGYARPYWHHAYYGHPVAVYHHRHW